ncbi:MAG: primary-amine oxidase [Cyanobacteria bacterium SZAS-4]|nr:primary-amine oxidase [Cyanobacteria bacterium SZAS-4]
METKTTPHPLDPLSAQEIELTTSILKEAHKTNRSSLFASISLLEPSKSAVLNFKAGERFKRQAFAVIYDLGSGKTFETCVDLTDKLVSSYKEAPGSARVPEDANIVHAIVRADSQWQQAMRKRGIKDLNDVYISVWAPGYMPTSQNPSRILKAIFYYQGHTGNAFLRPIEGVVADVDVREKKLVHLADSGIVPIAPVKEVRGVQHLKPLSIQQSEGPSFVVNGNEVHWQNWTFRFAVLPREGPVLYTVSYNDNGKVRPVLYRASCSELCVPYADPSSAWSFRDSFDVGELHLGLNTAALEAGKDAPNNAKFFDAIIANQFGAPITYRRALALYERDGGILWRHYDKPTKHNQSLRARDLVLSYITTLGNYDYGFNWIFREDGALECETTMTGIMLAKGVADDNSGTEHGHSVEKNVEAVHHQHFFCFRLDMDVDGASNNSLVETNTRSAPLNEANPYGNAFCMEVKKLHTEQEAKRTINLASTRRWKVINENCKNSLGQQTGYMLIPGENSLPYAAENSYVRKRAGYLGAHVWATPYQADQLYAAGTYPFNAASEDGLGKWTKANRSIENQDIVLWYTLGITHEPRPEEWPIMPVHRSGFKLIPNSFFSQNPSLNYWSD